MNDMPNTTREARKREMVTDLGPGAHECWYPVALSADVPQGKSVGVNLADGRIVVYRGEDGAVRAMTAYCKHMGADLSVGGDVIGNNIRCPYHHWAFGDGGRCKDIPSGDPMPKGSSLASLHTEEALGLIWVFFGETPRYELPTFDDFDETTQVYRAFEIEMKSKLNVEPWIFTTNIFDIVHNRVVHGLDIIDPEIDEVSPYRRSMVWDAQHSGDRETGRMLTSINVYGTNCAHKKGIMDGRQKWYVAGLTPCGSDGTRIFFSIVTSKDDGAEAFLDRAQAMHNRFVNEDIPILNHLRFGDLHLVGADKAMARFIRAAREYPRTTLDALETAANAKEPKPEFA